LTDDEREGLELVASDEDEAERLVAEPDRVFGEVHDDASVIELWRSVSGPAERQLIVLAELGHFAIFQVWETVATTLRDSALRS
jgi:hypothetical protein